VVGGGPAGCAAAIRLSQLGHSVCLLDRNARGRPHIGESLSPGVAQQLEYLGIKDAENTCEFSRFPGSQIKWRSSEWQFRRSRPGAATVDRSQFDGMLLSAAEQNHVRVLQPAVAVSSKCLGRSWSVVARTEDGFKTIEASFLLDASGRTGFLPSLRRREVPRTIALYGYWTGTDLPELPRVEASSSCWYWGSPVPGRGFNAMVFIDAANLKQHRPIHQYYRLLIDRSRLMAGATKARLSSRVCACDATPYLDRRSAGAGFIKVGEASVSLDPLSSSGVQSAIQSGISASIVVHTVLLRPTSEAMAQQFYQDSQCAAFARHSSWSAQHYLDSPDHQPSEFWRTRASTSVKNRDAGKVGHIPVNTFSTPLHVAREAMLRRVPCIVDNFVEECEAVDHPGFDRPIAYVGEHALASLLTDARSALTVKTFLDRLSARCGSASRALQLTSWMFQHGLLTAG
jgi:flavin-dependent dehydrogenase